MSGAAKPSDDLDLTSYPFFQKLTDLPFIDAIYLFGERAVKSGDARSAIDLAILCPGASGEEWKKVQQILKRANILLPIEAVRIDQLPASGMKRRILEQRAPLFVRTPSDHRTLITEMMPLLQWHLKVFKDALKAPMTKVENRNAAFEHYKRTIQYYWRVARRALLLSGVRCHSPLSTFRQTFSEGIIENRTLWEEMLEAWIQIRPLPTEEFGARLLPRLPAYLEALEAASLSLKKYIEEHHAEKN